MNLPVPVIILLVLLGVVVGIVAIVYIAAPVFQGIAWVLVNGARGIAWVFRHIFSFVYGMLSDLVRAFGGLFTAIVFVPLIVLNVLIGRWSAAGHFGRAFQDEVVGVGHCLYRVVIGHPARFFLLSGLVEGIEQRIPEAMKHAPGSDKPSGRTGQFDGYKIVGSLPGGGSGGRLYVAEPDDRKRAAFARSGREIEQVVIKAFSLSDGSSLPQIIRESRALEAAKKMGLILDHELTDARFYYVMEFIPGDSLTVVTKRLHSESGPQGLGSRQLLPALSMIGDLLTELDRYHRGGLWHKDVKPDNIVINQGRAHLVDLGLVTPLRSAMTLTTHGTEYFRDPELVRMALRGAKVNEVDGVKFDLYGVGAVLYSVIENSFPAHGGMSQITRSCPEALRWVVRRAMTDLQHRYATAAEMLTDLRAIAAASDPFMMKPADLPSVSGGAVTPPPVPVDEFAGMGAAVGVAAAARSPEPKKGFVFEVTAGIGESTPPAAGSPTPPPGERRRPRISVSDWWTGRYSADESRPFVAAPAAHAARRHARGPGRTAAEQLESARERVRRAQERISGRLSPGAFATSFGRSGRFTTRPNSGVAGAFFIFLAVCVAIPMFLVVVSLKKSNEEGQRAHAAALAAARERIDIDTEFGRLTVGLGQSENDAAETFKESVRAFGEAFRETAREIKVDARTRDGNRQGDVAELNKIGQKISTFFDKLRDQKPAAPTADDPGPAPSPPTPVEVPSAPALPIGEAGTVLVLNLLPGDMTADEQPRLARLKERLNRAGFAVRGVDSTDEDTDLLAGGKRVVELAQPDDADAARRVQSWISNPETGVDAVLWIGAGRTPDAVQRRLIVRDGFSSGKVASALSAR